MFSLLSKSIQHIDFIIIIASVELEVHSMSIRELSGILHIKLCSIAHLTVTCYVGLTGEVEAVDLMEMCCYNLHRLRPSANVCWQVE